MDQKLKHLEFIQNIITRLNTNSFQIKGMSITLTTALLAILATNGNIYFSIIPFFPLIIFWGLDAFYLSKEKQYRNLYEEIVLNNSNITDFSLKILPKHINKSNNWTNTLINKTVLPIFLGQIIICLIIICIILCNG